LRLVAGQPLPHAHEHRRVYGHTGDDCLALGQAGQFIHQRSADALDALRHPRLIDLVAYA